MQRNDICGLKTSCDQLVDHVLPVGQSKLKMILYAFGHHGHLTGLVQLYQVDVSSAQNAHHCFALYKILYFVKTSHR